MPCYDPTPANQLEMYPQWLCQAFKPLKKEQIMSIKGILANYCEKQTAYDWYIEHLQDDAKYSDSNVRKEYAIERLKELKNYNND